MPLRRDSIAVGSDDWSPDPVTPDRAGSAHDLPDCVHSPESEDHLRALAARDRAIVLDAVDDQLTNQPTTETRNRKPLRPNPLAPWELLLGDLRVYYDVEDDPEPIVHVRAVGIKDHNVLRIGGEIYQL